MKKLFEPKKPTILTRAVIFIFLFLTALYLLDKFFDSYTLQSPIKIQFLSPIKKRGIIYRENKKVFKKGQNLNKFKAFNTMNTGGVDSDSRFSSNFTNERRPTASDNTSPYDAIYIFFGEDKVALAIAKAESGLNCKAISKTNDYGLFQINHIHFWRFEKFNGKWDSCFDNTKVAYEIWKEQNWRPWVVWQTGVYKKFIN